MSEKRPPVRVRLFVETGFANADYEDVIDIDRDEWEAMSVAEQEARCQEELDTFTWNCIGTSYTVLEADDA